MLNNSTESNPGERTDHSVTDQPTVKEITVLAVDDDSSLLDLTKTFLERESDSFDVITDTRADKAVSKLVEGEIAVDAIVSDYDMPAMSGIDFLESIREEFPDLPFILFTGKGSEEIASDAISAGVTDYLQKGTGSSQYSVLSNRLLNVVEKYRANQQLERSERKFSKLVENSSDQISIVSEEGRFEYVSPSSEHILGYSQDEMVGDSVFNFVHPDDRQEVMEEFFEAIENPGMNPNVEFELNHPETDGIIIESRGTNLLEDDVVSGFVVNSRNITDLKKREEDLKHRNEQLENIKSLLSRDIRNPLNIALGSIELYYESEERTHIEKVEKALNRIETLIEQTNHLADQQIRIEKTDTVSLKDIVWSAWEMVETRNSTLQIGGSKQIEADADSVRQLFENLIKNAVEHGGREITCSVGTTETGFYFEDDGDGIPEEDYELVFESGYTTGDNSMGLGLTIVEQIVAKHGWEIDAVDGSDSGARFDITGVTFQPAVYE